MKKQVRFGIIGCGLMGREFGSAIARWCHLTDDLPKPVLTAVCDSNAAAVKWFADNFSSVTLATSDYRELIASGDVDAVYCALPHNLHAGVYCDIIRAGKHLMGEKPFGIDQEANALIMEAIAERPDVFVRCSSEFPFVPAVQALCGMIETNAFGSIIQVDAGFLHSSDLDPLKPINWKRRIATNGRYGCMGDLGLHVCHVPFRAGWFPLNVRAILSKIVTERPDGKGGSAPCETWDNATLLCETAGVGQERFPMTLKMQRIAPGELNTWFMTVLGTRASARFSTKDPGYLEVMRYSPGPEQSWQKVEIGYSSTFRTITGTIFQFGFSDAILQMWAAFIHELSEGAPRTRFSGCATPREAALSHQLFTAALQSNDCAQVVTLSRPAAGVP